MATDQATGDSALDRADAERNAGRIDEAAALYEHAAEDSRARDDVDGWVRAVLGLATTQEFGSDPGNIPARLHEVHGRLDASPARARVAAALARCWAYAGQGGRAAVFAAEALALSKDVDDVELRADCLDAALAAHWGPDGADERRRLATELDEVVAHSLDPDTLLRAHLWGLEVSCEALDLPAAYRHLHVIERLGREMTRARLYGASRRLMLSLLRDDVESAEHLCVVADESAAGSGLPDAWMVQIVMRGNLAIQTGDMDGCRTAAARCEEYALAEGFPLACALAAYWWIGGGRPDRASVLLRMVAGPALEGLPKDVNWLPTVQIVLLVALEVVDEQAIAQAEDLLAPYNGNSVFDSGAIAFYGLTDDTLSRAADIRGDRRRADRLRSRALATYERIGSGWWRERLLATSPERPEGPRPVHLHPTADALWLVGPEGSATVVPALRGLGYLRELLSRPGQDVTALDLVGRERGHASAQQADLGGVIDQQARDAYRRRLHELDEEIAEAEDWGDAGRLEVRTRERDALIAELARATGLGGASRTTGSTSERARVAVRKAIVGALARVGEVDAATARHLRDRVRTGAVCRYEPDPDHPVEWVLS